MSTETPSYLYWVGGGLGAVTLSIVSATIMWFVEKRAPTVRTVGRDLILGAILFFLLLQLLPESTLSLVTGLLALVAVQNEIIESGSSSSVAAAVAAAADDIELRLGVPTF